MVLLSFKSAALIPILAAPAVKALEIDFQDSISIGHGLFTVANGVMNYYTGNNYDAQNPNDTANQIGMFSHPYYWWEAGAAWGALIDYWYYTGDPIFNGDVWKALVHQLGPGRDYMPENQTMTEGNDDQGFWGLAVMSAAEKDFPTFVKRNGEPLEFDGISEEGDVSWIEAAQGVFKDMAERWDTSSCNGGLRWQIYTWNNGYDYKNSVANGCLFNLAARLARFTGEKAYAQWATKIWEWMVERNFIETDTSDWKVRDGAKIANDCSEVSKTRWSYNAGLFMGGAAVMYNVTGLDVWRDRTEHLWEGSQAFFLNDKIMYEGACQPTHRCNADQRSFKGIFSRFLGLTALYTPSIRDDIMSKLEDTTPGVLKSCTGGVDGVTCGLDWSADRWDGEFGLGEQLSALEALQTRLIFSRPGPLTVNDFEYY